MNHRDHNDANLVATLMLDSAARRCGRDVSRAARAAGPLTFEVTPRPGDQHRTTPAHPAATTSRTTGEWAGQLAAAAARLRV